MIERMRAAGPRCRRQWCGVALVAGFLAVGAGAANAQETTGIGVGGRLTSIRTDTSIPDNSNTFWGAFLRARASERMALELSLDYRSESTDLQKVTFFPVQGSVLLYPVRSTFGLYLIGGVGWYSERVSALDAAGEAGLSITSRRFGTHAGLGGEIELGRRAALHVDYRYTFLHFGDDDRGPSGGALPVPGTIGLQEKLKLTHEGSMWTSGITFYF